MIKTETDTVQLADERYTDRQQMRTAHSQDRQELDTMSTHRRALERHRRRLEGV